MSDFFKHRHRREVRRWVVPALVGALGLLVAVVYSNSLRGGMVIDNQVLILNDPRLRATALENLRLIFTQEYWWPTAGAGLYRPVATLSYWFNYALLRGGENLTGYHVVNMLLQWLNATLAFFVFAKVFHQPTVAGLVPSAEGTGEKSRRFTEPPLQQHQLMAFFAAALFAIHPVGTEAVTNVIGRTDLLAATGVLGALLCYLRGMEAAGWRRTGWLVAMAVTAAVGMFAKENAAVVIAVIILYDVAFRRDKLREAWRWWLALAPIYILFFVARKLVFARTVPSQFPFVDNPLVAADFWTSRLTAIKVLGRYLWLAVWPQSLSCDYSYNQIPVVAWDWGTSVALVALAGLAVLAVWAWRHHKPLFFCLAFAAGTMFPTSNLLVHIGNIMGERYLYLPLLGLAGAAVIAVGAIGRDRWPALLTVAVIVYGTRTYVRNADWRNSLNIWSSAVQVCPNSFKTQKSYAHALNEAGRDIDEVIGIAERARAIIEQRPLPLAQQSYGVYADLGSYYVEKAEQMGGALNRTQQYRQAVDYLEHAAAIEEAVSRELAEKLARQGRPTSELSLMGDFHIYGNLGLAHLRLGEYQQSSDAYRHMRRLAPGNAKGYLGIALAYDGQGQVEAAAAALLSALLLQTDDAATWQMVMDFYSRRFSGSDALVVVDGRPRLNLQSKLVRRQLCEAYRQLAGAYRDSGGTEMAQQLEATAQKEYGCQ